MICTSGDENNAQSLRLCISKQHQRAALCIVWIRRHYTGGVSTKIWILPEHTGNLEKKVCMGLCFRSSGSLR